MERNDEKMNRKKLSLINYEGDCLKAIKPSGTNSIHIYDQYGVLLREITEQELFAFIDGLYEIEDSKGKFWNFTKEHKDAKPSMSQVYKFIKEDVG